MDHKVSAAMLAVKRLEGVAPEVNLRNPLHVSNEACNWRIQSWLQTRGRCHQKSILFVLEFPSIFPVQRCWQTLHFSFLLKISFGVLMSSRTATIPVFHFASYRHQKKTKTIDYMDTLQFPSVPFFEMEV